MTVTIKLYDANHHLIYTFENNRAINSNTFSNTYLITPAIYKNVGAYTVVIQGTDNDGTQSYTLSLIVNPVPDSIPVISSSPITQVNEGAAYLYQVVASDADGDTLAYSLSQSPSWLSINPSTGLISGTAPSVTANTNYAVSVNVSDGVNIVTQSYTLTVDYIAPANIPPVISSSPITQVNEGAAYLYQVVASDADGDTLAYSLSQSPSWLSINPSTGLISGTAPSVTANTNYAVSVNVSDGVNIVTQSYTLTVDYIAPIISDTIPPVVNLISPSNNFDSNKSMQTFNASATDNVALSNLTLYIWNSTGLVSSNTKSVTGISNLTSWILSFASDGNYIWNVLGMDAAGNANWSQQGNYTLLIDTTSPQVQFVNPTPSENSVLTSTTISANLTALDLLSGLDTLNIYLYNSTSIIGNVSKDSSPFAFNFINLQPGVYYLNATAMDNFGNMNSTQTLTITLQSFLSLRLRFPIQQAHTLIQMYTAPNIPSSR